MCEVKELLQQELINLRNGPNIGKEIEACKKKNRFALSWVFFVFCFYHLSTIYNTNIVM